MDCGFFLLLPCTDAAQFYIDRGHAYLKNRGWTIKTVQVDTAQRPSAVMIIPSPVSGGQELLGRQSKLPVRLRKIRSEEVKEERRLAKEHDALVFRLQLPENFRSK
ncbi:MAG TPA: hypothetical protein VL122_09385 [Nitrospirota bacterium]|nr:hypothetical protein [Nitrospirota bacterium]